MPDLRLPLTDKNVLGLPFATTGQYRARDLDLGGFYLLVGKRTKSFVVAGDLRAGGLRQKTVRMPIGTLAKATGVKVPTIRFYEGIGLLREPRRTESDRRIYDEAAVSRLAFIKHARQLGFSVDAVRDLLDLEDNPDRPCEQANLLAAAQLATVEAKIGQLQALRVELSRMVDAACHGRASDCRVIEVLSDHALCAHDHAEPAATRR